MMCLNSKVVNVQNSAHARVEATRGLKVSHGVRVAAGSKRQRGNRSVRASGKGFGDKPQVGADSPKPQTKQQVPFQFDINAMDALGDRPEPSVGNPAAAVSAAMSPKADLDALMGEGKSKKELPENPDGSPGRIEIVVSMDDIMNLDLKSVKSVLDPKLAQGAEGVQELLGLSVGFKLEYKKNPGDPRELCEIPDVRLWFLRLDAEYPWIPCALDWRAGELARYAAMLIPHQISAQDGLVYNPEGLELFLNGKLFVTYYWLKNTAQLSQPATRVKDMLLMLGYATSDELFALL